MPGCAITYHTRSEGAQSLPECELACLGRSQLSLGYGPPCSRAINLGILLLQPLLVSGCISDVLDLLLNVNLLPRRQYPSMAVEQGASVTYPTTLKLEDLDCVRK